jgi:catechol 2,3-dioxygenase
MKPTPFMTGTRVSYIAISVRNLARSIAFYQNDLGFSILSQTATSVDLGSASGEHILTLVERPDSAVARRQLGLYHFAILLPTRQDLGAFLRHLIVRQTPVGGSADHGVSEAFYLEDPDQNGIEVYADKDTALWYDEFKQMTMTTREIDYEGLYYEVDSDDSYRGIPEGTILGHLHLYVADLERSRHFYVDGIGFSMTVDSYPGALFLSDNGYHHHVAINIWLGKHAKPRQKNAVGLEQATFVFSTCESLQGAIDRLTSLGYPVKETANGYSTNDPDGNPIALQARQ